jgi:hypothetical protein
MTAHEPVAYGLAELLLGWKKAVQRTLDWVDFD